MRAFRKIQPRGAQPLFVDRLGKQRKIGIARRRAQHGIVRGLLFFGAKAQRKRARHKRHALAERILHIHVPAEQELIAVKSKARTHVFRSPFIFNSFSARARFYAPRRGLRLLISEKTPRGGLARRKPPRAHTPKSGRSGVYRKYSYTKSSMAKPPPMSVTMLSASVKPNFS